MRKALTWLPAELHPAVERLLLRPQRLAPEAVGLELLTSTPAAALRTVTAGRR